jgi:uncharacterized protein involved in exopolysaccharide biosynthesis
LALKKHLTISDDKKSGLVTAVAEDKDPVFSASLVNSLVPELRKLLDRIAVTEAQQRRRFLEERITIVQSEMNTLETRLIKAQATSGVLSVDGQTQTAIRQAAEVRGQITATQIRIDSMATFATAENPEMQRAKAELEGLQRKLSELERGSASVGSAASGEQDAAALDNLRAYRDLKYRQATLDVLVKEVEVARIDEAKEGALVQQVDPGVPPEKRSRPQRSVIVAVGMLLGFLLGGAVTVMRQKDVLVPYANQLRELRRAWSMRRRG